MKIRTKKQNNKANNGPAQCDFARSLGRQEVAAKVERQ